MHIYPSGTLIAYRYEVVQGPREKPSLAGGMGLVYLCVDHAENGRPVALKTFRPELLPDRAGHNFRAICADFSFRMIECANF